MRLYTLTSSVLEILPRLVSPNKPDINPVPRLTPSQTLTRCDYEVILNQKNGGLGVAEDLG